MLIRQSTVGMASRPAAPDPEKGRAFMAEGNTRFPPSDCRSGPGSYSLLAGAAIHDCAAGH